MEEILSLFDFLKQHVKHHTRVGFSDLVFSLETLIESLLNEIAGAGTFVNANSITHNYPAIDLFDKGSGTAIQITVDADKDKAKETLKTYQRHGLAFSELIVIGFCSCSKVSVPGIKLVGLEYLTRKIKTLPIARKVRILNLLREEIPLHLLSPIRTKRASPSFET